MKTNSNSVIHAKHNISQSGHLYILSQWLREADDLNHKIAGLLNELKDHQKKLFYQLK